jgi:hypothetical protein
MPFEITLISVLRALIEVAMLMLLLRGILWLFGPRARQGNFFYDILSVGTAPFTRGTRFITPKLVRDAYVPVLTFVLLFCVYLALGIAKAAICAARGLECM